MNYEKLLKINIYLYEQEVNATDHNFLIYVPAYNSQPISF